MGNATGVVEAAIMSYYFTQKELACRHCGQGLMDADFLAALDILREVYGSPIILNSGYRCPMHNMEVSKTGPRGPHTTGRSVDVLVYGAEAHRLIELALRWNFTGVGVSQRGPHDQRFVHLDTLSDAPGQPRPWVWSY